MGKISEFLRSRTTITTVVVTATVTGHDDIHIGTRIMRPTRIEVKYVDHHDGDGWDSSGHVEGRNVRQDGSLGTKLTRWILMISYPDPEWVTEFVRDNMPTEADLS